MKAEVYWSTSHISPLRDTLDLLWECPTTLLHEVKEEIRKNTLPTNESTGFLNCPSMALELSNTLVIKSPIDYTILWDGVNITSPDLNQDFINKVINVRDMRTGVISLNLRTIFFANSPMNMFLSGAHFSSNNFVSNTRMFPGTFDISKWFRPLDVTFQITSKNKPIVIKRGDHLMYLRMHSTSSFELLKFHMTPEIDNIAYKCLGVKDILPNKSLKFLYDLFANKSKQDKKLISLIKQNLVKE